MLRKFDNYVAQLNNAETAGTKNIRVKLVDCVDQAWLMDCLFSGSIKRPDGYALSHMDEVMDLDIRNLYLRLLAPGERPAAVDCAYILTYVKWPSESDILSVENASETYKLRIVRAFRDPGHLNFLEDQYWDDIARQWLPPDHHMLTRLLTRNIRSDRLRDCIDKNIKQHRIRGKLFSSWRKLLEENARMVTLGKTQNVTGKHLTGDAGTHSRRDRGNKRYNSQ